MQKPPLHSPFNVSKQGGRELNQRSIGQTSLPIPSSSGCVPKGEADFNIFF